MPQTRTPRHGSMQFWPRKRAHKPYARVRSYVESDKAQPLGFAGYKVGMVTLFVVDDGKTSKTKGQEIAVPGTIIECPPIKIASARFYKKDGYGIKVVKEVFFKFDKELERKIPVMKKEGKLDDIDPKEYSEIRLNVYTQPKMTGIGKKKPELFELALGGSVVEQLNFIKEHHGKDIFVGEVFGEGNILDFHVITKGKGFQGPVKRFGVGLRNHKSEKTKRGPGSLGGWKGQGHFMYRIAHAGQMGFHQRVEYNKKILKIGDKPEEINAKGGFIRYGEVKNQYIVVRGSVGGPSKRLVRFNFATRPHKNKEGQPTVTFINIESRQGN